MTSVTNAEGEVTEYEYDDYGRLATVTVDPDPGLDLATHYEYDDYVGNLTAVVDAEGKRTDYEYDYLNRQKTITYDDGTTVEYVYTYPGPVQTVTTEQGTTTYSYDELDRATSVEDPLGNEVAYAYDDFAFSETAPYVTRTDSVTDRDSRLTEYDYDVFGRLETMTVDPASLAIETAYDYDENGNVTKLTDGEGNETDFVYDHRDRLTTTRYAEGTAKETTLEYTYDANGNLWKRKDRNMTWTEGEHIVYTYDDLDRLSQTAYPNDGTVGWSYDNVGRPLWPS